MVNLYKSLVLSYIESGTAAYYHAAVSVLLPIDRVQRRLLRELGLSEREALERYKLAPLETRRDIAMLGLLHRISIGQAPLQLTELFPRALPPRPRAFSDHTRLHTALKRQDRQFLERSSHTDVFRKSIFGLVASYNLLPQSVVDIATVQGSQRELQNAVLEIAQGGLGGWPRVLSGTVIRRQVTFQRLFKE